MSKNSKESPKNSKEQLGKTTIKRVASQQLALMCLQTEAREWIEQVLHEALPEDFSVALKDGVILCRLMKALDSGESFSNRLLFNVILNFN